MSLSAQQGSTVPAWATIETETFNGETVFFLQFDPDSSAPGGTYKMSVDANDGTHGGSMPVEVTLNATVAAGPVISFEEILVNPSVDPNTPSKDDPATGMWGR